MARGDEGGVLGIIVAGGASPLEGLGAPDDAALTPFAGKYRLLDFSLATLTNSGVRPVYVIAAGAGRGAPAPPRGAGRARGDLRRPVIVPARHTGGAAGARAASAGSGTRSSALGSSSAPTTPRPSPCCSPTTSCGSTCATSTPCTGASGPT